MKKDLLDDDQSSVPKELCRWCAQHTESFIKGNGGVKVVRGAALREDENNRIA